MHYCNLDEDDVSIGGNDGKMIDEEESRGPMSLPTVATLATSQVCSSQCGLHTKGGEYIVEFDSKWIFIISSPFHLQAKFVKVAKQGRARMQFSIDSYDSRDRKEMPYHLKLTSRPDSALSFTSDVEETASLNLESEPRIAKELRTEMPMLAPSEKEQAQTQPPPPPAAPAAPDR